MQCLPLPLKQMARSPPLGACAELERKLQRAREDLTSRRKTAEKRHRARLTLNAKKAEIVALQHEYESTFDRSNEGLP